MKKFILMLLSVITLTSCECYWAEEVRREKECGVSGLITSDLLGTWGSTDLKFGNEYVKEIKIYNIDRYGEGYALIQLQDIQYTNRYNRDYTFIYSGNYLTFFERGYERAGGFQMEIVQFLPGSLYVKDRYGTHELRWYGNCNDSGF